MEKRKHNKLDTPWNILIALTASYIALFIPLDLVFNFEGIDIYDLSHEFVTLIFVADILYHIYKYKNCRNHYFTEKSNCLDEYFRKWFLIDILAALPLVYFFDSDYVQLFRLLKLIRVASFMSQWKRKEVRYATYLSLTFFIFWISISAHWVSVGWLYLRGVDSSISHFDNYINSLYWCVTTLTTVGYGDITPITSGQKIFAIFVEALGVGVYGYLIGNIAGIFTKTDPAKQRYLENLDKLRSLTKYRKIPIDLQTRLRDYYTYIWNKRLGYDEDAFLHDLPENLKVELSLQLKREAIDRINLFRNADEQFKREIALHLKPIILTPGSFAFREGDEGRELYFVINGKLNVIIGGDNVVATLGEGSFFGEIALFMDVKRTAAVEAVTYCDLYQLTKKAFDYVVAKYPHIHQQVKEEAEKRQKKSSKPED